VNSLLRGEVPPARPRAASPTVAATQSPAPPPAGKNPPWLKALVATLAIGAFGVADAAEALEAAIRDGGETSEALSTLRHAVAQARTAIDAMLRRS